MRQRVKAAVGKAVSSFSATVHHRRSTSAMTPLSSAASWRRRDAVRPKRVTSPTTAASPDSRRPSSMAGSTSRSWPLSAKITRSGWSPAAARPGANRSRRERHQSTGPSKRATIPARNKVAEPANSAAGLASTTSWRAERGRPPERCRSIAGIPKGRAPLRGRSRGFKRLRISASAMRCPARIMPSPSVPIESVVPILFSCRGESMCRESTTGYPQAVHRAA